MIPHSIQARLGALVLGVVVGVLVFVQMFEDLNDLEEDEDESLEDRPDAIVIPFRGGKPS